MRKKYSSLIVSFLFCLSFSTLVQASPSKDDLIQHLNNDRFDSLEGIFINLQNNYGQYAAKEKPLLDAFNVFREVVDEKQLNKWVSAKPKSVYALLARATYYVKMGFKARGGQLAKDTATEQFNNMEKYFDKAVADINRTMSINPLVVQGHILLISIYRASRSEDISPVISLALKLNPYSLGIRSAAIRALSPRWGGSDKLMVDLVQDSHKYYDRNPALKNIEGYLAYERAHEAYHFEKNYPKALQYYDEALTYAELQKDADARTAKGWALLKAKWGVSGCVQALSEFNYALQIHENDEEGLLGKSTSLYCLRDTKGAIETARLAIKLYPNRYSMHALLARIYSQQKKLDEAIQEMEIALKHEPNNKEYQAAMQEYQNNRDALRSAK